jgi:prophage maintenance system killer protein
MASKRRTIKQLADEAQLDVDEVLLRLWDAGFPNIKETDYIVGRKNLNRAKKFLGSTIRPTGQELKKFTYWMKLLGKNKSELEALLHELGVTLTEKTRKLPPKAIARLKSEVRKRKIDPIIRDVNQSDIPADIPAKATQSFAFKWPTQKGHKCEITYLTEEQVTAIHFELVKDFSSGPDPIIPSGVRSCNLLASAVFHPYTSLGEILKYPTVESSAAALLYSIIQDHPFHNGNKRTALVSSLVFLDKNNFFPEFNEAQAFSLVLKVARHRITASRPQNLADREVLAITDWFYDHCRPIEKGNHPISFRKLRQILVAYRCELENTTGSRMNISLTTENTRLFRKPLTLHTQILFSGEGREVGKNAVQKIRKDLQLDNAHGVDSYAFYDKDPLMATDFIVRYRKTLDRLAKY